MELTNIPQRPAVASKDALKEWLDFASADLSARLKDLTPMMFRLSVDHPEIHDEETAGIFTENLRMIAALKQAAESFHHKEKSPYWTAGKQVDNWLNDFVTVLDGMAAPLRVALRNFTIERDRARVFDEKKPVRGIYGGKASLKQVWMYEIEDITKVPTEYLTVKDDMVKAVLADRDPKTKVPRQAIPGIRWVQKPVLAVS